MDHIRFVGLDVQKERISVAVAESGRCGSVDYLGEIANDANAVSKLCDRLGRSGKRLAFCYEAGPSEDVTDTERCQLLGNEARACGRCDPRTSALAPFTEPSFGSEDLCSGSG
ncbi:hypothetical protein [Mesorhizobium sp. M0895]|uniref:hypothetical protein n=1 Tax=Mesorhizobium sp. M0895 TaxID=2957019 RepID=UPI00333D96CA